VWHAAMVGGPDWRAVLARDDRVELRGPLSTDIVDRFEASLGTVLPSALRALYLVTDGVLDKDGEWFVIWPLERTADENRRAWTDTSATRRLLLGFGDDGTGAPFCVPRNGGTGVFVWKLIDQQAYRLAGDIEESWEGWRTGAITT
jgi:hypothetical protein